MIKEMQGVSKELNRLKDAKKNAKSELDFEEWVLKQRSIGIVAQV